MKTAYLDRTLMPSNIVQINDGVKVQNIEALVKRFV